MTLTEQITQLVVVIGLSRKLTREEKKELAGLIGYYIHGKKGPVPKGKKHLPHFGESDFRTPTAYKALAEKIIGCSLPDPHWKEGCPAGTIKSKFVQERKKERATIYIDADHDKPSMHIFIDLADSATESKINSVIRDVREGIKPALLTPESYEKYGKPAMEKDIQSSLKAMLNKHRTK